jgi:putative ubiquitin-RnfH superfamily antitoxin RatB of RatAB toxin-antitoxin module
VIRVTVVLATPKIQEVVPVDLPTGGSPVDALARSGLAAAYALPLAELGFAVRGRRVGAHTRLADGDRVEITRALDADPKEARRLRAARRGGVL